MALTPENCTRGETVPDYEVTLEEVKRRAEDAHLPLPDDEAERLMKGINRMQRAAIDVRRHVTPDLEPHLVFAPEVRP